MAALDEALVALQASVGAETASAIVRRLIHVPGALEWLGDEPVRAALARAAETEAISPATALLAATGHNSLAALPDVWPAPMAARREVLLSGDPSGEPLSPDDVLILTGELVRADRTGGVAAVDAQMMGTPMDWRAALAVAWPAISDRGALASRLAGGDTTRSLTALLCALRSNQGDADAASALAAAAGARLNEVLPRLVELGDPAFASMVAFAADHVDQTGAGEAEDVEISTSALRRRLQEAWETRRGELAALTDALATAAAYDGDPVSALEARQQALQLGPSDARLADMAITVAEKGDASGALALLPSSPSTPPLGLAAGFAYLKGGAVEKGRAILVRSAIDALETGDPRPSPAMASALVASGEPALALDVYSAVLAANPSDVTTRGDYAQTLAEVCDYDGALVQARISLALDASSTAARGVEAESLRRLGRPREALAALQDPPMAADSGLWRTAVECAIDLADGEQAQSLLANPPADVPGPDRIVLGARAAAAAGRQAEATALLEAATVDHPGESGLWVALARLHADAGDIEGSFVTLRRATQMVPGSAPIHAALAQALRLQRRPSEALAEARQAIRFDGRDPNANLEAGLALLALGRPTEAVEPLRLSYRRRPGDLAIRLALAEAFGATGEIDAARSLVAHLPTTAPAEAWMMSGRLELLGDSPADAGRAATAASRLLRARSLGLQDAALSLWLGRAFEAAGDPARAAEAYGEYLGSEPGDPDQARFAALHKAHCRLAAGDTLGAIGDFESLRAAYGEDRRVLAPLARAYCAGSLADEARQTAEALLTIEPTDRDGLDVLTALARQTGKWSHAAKAYKSAAELASADPNLWLMTAEASLAAGDPAAAGPAVEKAMAGSQESDLLRRAAHILVGLGRLSTASETLKRSAQAAPDDPGVWIELADVSEASGDPAEAVEALSRAADLSPWDAEIQARRAAALFTAGRRTESIDAWKKALALAPDDLRIHRSLARALVCDGQVEAGLSLYASALETHPTDIDLLSEAGKATLGHGSATEAVDLLQRAAAARPTPDTLAGLGEGWLRLGRPEQALEILRKATSLADVPPRAWALYAEAAVSTGDLATAEAAIIEARRPDVVEADDRLALARAELRLANWSDSLTALAPILSTHERDRQLALAMTILRVLEAKWLFGEAACARRHAPQADVPSDALVAWLESFIHGTAAATGEERLLGARLRLVRSSDDDEALTTLREAAAQGSTVAETLEALAIALLRGQQMSEALNTLRLIQPDHLGSSWQALLAGLAHLHTGNPSLARQAFVDASDDAGLRPMAQALLARAHLAQGYSESAIAALNSALTRWPDEPAWHAALADLYLASDDLDAALPHLQAAAELEPENAAWRLAHARALRDAGHLGDSLAAFERVLPLLASEPQVWHEAGELALAAGDLVQSESFFDRAISLAPAEPIHLVGKAKTALAAGKPRDARRHAERSIELGGERSDALQCLAAVAARQGEAERAVELLDRARAVSHDEAGLRRVRTRLLIDVGRAEQAAQELRVHLAEDPDDDEAWPSLAEALEAIEDYPAAGQALEAALRLRPRAADLHIRLARIERKSGQLDRALELLRQAEAIDPLQADLSLELGQVYEARRELDHALDAYCRSIEVNPRSPEAFRRAGHMYKSLKAYAEAEAMLQRAADLDPTDTATLQQLAAVRALELVHGGTYRMAVNP